ncbi:AAA family ATPase [Burkholderia sp. B21-005]|uniref:AAA family ATPase n=1 Tax=Burkholderia sp. B21-005 TaxID=2890406 RepID=UPI001E5A3F3B|nr:AAA family ATPase [Burkholderia sp. B21-005]UEP43162.1 AAA family ATPase [Burkholderia sp. B21-005]
MRVIPDDIDFTAYLKDDDDGRAYVRPASEWADEVIDYFHGHQEVVGQPTPWEKVGEKVMFRPGEMTLWAGVNGHGKSGALSYVMLSAMVDGGKACIASFEMMPQVTMRNLNRQAVGAFCPAVESIRSFHRWTDDRLWLYAHRGQVTPERMLAVTRYCRKELGLDHMVIDSLMKCGMAPDDYAGQKDFVDALCVLARDTGIHIHLVHHVRKSEREFDMPDKFSVKGAGEITDLVDNVLIVFRNKRKEAQLESEKDPVKLQEIASIPDTFLICAKQRHFSWEGKISLWFDKDSQQLLERPNSGRRYIDFDSGKWKEEWKR